MLEIKKKINPNRLPFLQAQILQKIYTDISENQITTLEELAELTDYPRDSKILKACIDALIAKGFLEGSLSTGFSVPMECRNIYQKTIQRKDIAHKSYSDKIIRFFDSTNLASFHSTLFTSENSVSELNAKGVVHHWYDYLEDFPFELIESKLQEYNIQPNSLVVEPFAGSGTTCVASNFFSCNSIAFDANPLMCFISQVKTTWQIDLDLYANNTLSVAQEFLNNIRQYEKLNLPPDFLVNMPKKELNQWLSPSLQKEAHLLKNIIIQKVKEKNIKNLLLLALSKSCLDASYVSFCPGTTFYPFREKPEFWDLFTEKTIQIFNDLQIIQKYSHYGSSQIINDSCLNASQYIKPNSIDFIITSPPYPNDLEYTRQTRMEMYLLDFVKNMSDVQNIKKKMVKGSTKLIFKDSHSDVFIQHFDSVHTISQQIYLQTKDKNWGFDYPKMVREYFGDMFLCLREFFDLLKPNAYFLLVVGDQTIKGVYIPVCDILIEMAQEIGYKNCRKELFRNRRSTGHNIILPEEIVILQK